MTGEQTLDDRDSSGSDNHGARFDRREMLIVHAIFRREFALMPGLVCAVADGDRDRAELVGDHIDGLTSLLHHHHRGEDYKVWPLLEERCGNAIAALTESMLDQHERLARCLDAVDVALENWRVDGAADSRERLIHALDATLPLLWDHLDGEERCVVPLMEQQISASEWNDMVQAGSVDADPAGLPLAFGMLMYEGDPEIIERVLGAMPAEVRPVMSTLAAQTFVQHSRTIHGTPTPPRSTELMGSRHG